MNKIKILIADDNKSVAELMKSFIEKNSDFKILDIATSSVEQLEIMGKHNPDVVITDIMRKGESVSGLDIIRVCQKQDKKVKFILVTASDKREFFRNEEEIPRNIIGYLRKPFDWNELIIQLQRADMIVSNCTYGLDPKYYSLPIINLEKELSAEEKVIMEKLDAKVESRIYTHHEYDIVKQKLTFYYNEDEDGEEERKFKMLVEDKNVTKEEFKQLIQKLDYLDEKYIYKK